MPELSIVIPAKNEVAGLRRFLPQLREAYPDGQIVVVDDGSSDDTRAFSLSRGVEVVAHAYSKGNGAAIKSGARFAEGEWLVFMDGDGRHNPDDIAALAEMMARGDDMVVGARQGLASQASVTRWDANTLSNRIASWMVNHPIPDLTSGLRMVKRSKFMEFLYPLPNGFYYPTTTTMAFFRAGYSVGFLPIEVARRVGKCHINSLRDGLRFFLIVIKVGTLYSPLRIFFPISFVVFSSGLSNYLYTYIIPGRFTNMSAMLMLASILIFLFGLLSEQITNLSYKDID